MPSNPHGDSPPATQRIECFGLYRIELPSTLPYLSGVPFSRFLDFVLAHVGRSILWPGHEPAENFSRAKAYDILSAEYTIALARLEGGIRFSPLLSSKVS